MFSFSGSPFHPKVCDPRQVVMLGGWESILDAAGVLSVNVLQVTRLDFDVSNAGPGKCHPANTSCWLDDPLLIYYSSTL